MSNAARTLFAVAILAIVVGLAVALAGALIYGATLPGAQTHARPASEPTVYRAPGS